MQSSKELSASTGLNASTLEHSAHICDQASKYSHRHMTNQTNKQTISSLRSKKTAEKIGVWKACLSNLLCIQNFYNVLSSF